MHKRALPAGEDVFLASLCCGVRKEIESSRRSNDLIETNYSLSDNLTRQKYSINWSDLLNRGQQNN